MIYKDIRRVTQVNERTERRGLGPTRACGTSGIRVTVCRIGAVRRRSHGRSIGQTPDFIGSGEKPAFPVSGSRVVKNTSLPDTTRSTWSSGREAVNCKVHDSGTHSPPGFVSEAARTRFLLGTYRNFHDMH